MLAKKLKNFQRHMQPRRHHTGARAGSHARSAGQPRIDAVDNAHRRHRAAQRKAAIGSEIGKSRMRKEISTPSATSE